SYTHCREVELTKDSINITLEVNGSKKKISLK
ncbi:unnamed protein product, partial [marine sediment metagenome]